MCAEESLGLGLTEDDGDEESDLPDFLLPDDSSKTRKPLPYFRTGTAPKIYKASLKDYHGLEGVSLLGGRTKIAPESIFLFEAKSIPVSTP